MRRQGQLWSASSESDDDEPKRSYFNDNPRRGTAIARAAAAPPPPPPPVATPPRDRRGVHPPPSTANSGGGRVMDVGGEGSSGSPRTCSPHSKTSAYSSATTEEEHDASSEGSYEYTYSYSSAGSSAAAEADAEEGGSDTSMTSATAERIATMAAYEVILHREQQLKLMEAQLLRQKEAFSREVRSRSSQRGEDEDISMLVRNQMQQTIPAPHVEAPQPPPLALPPPPPHDADREVSLPPSTSPAPDPPTSRRSSSRRFSVPPLPLSVATANTGTSPIHHHDAEVVEVHRHRENPPQPPPAAEMEMNQPTFVLDPLHRHNRSLQPWANVASNWPTRSPPPVPVEEPRVRNSANAWATTFAGAPLSRQDFTALLRGDDVLADPRVAEKKKPSRSLRAPTPSCSSSSSSSSEAKRPSSDSRTPSRHRSLPDVPTTNQRRGTAAAAVASRKHHEPFAEDQEPITSESRSVGSIKSAESSTLDFPTPPPEIDGAEEYCCGWFDGNCCSCCPGCWDAMTSTLARIFCCCREER